MDDKLYTYIIYHCFQPCLMGIRFGVAYLKARMFVGILYQPFFKREASQSAERRWLAIAVMPRWGIALRIVEMAGYRCHDSLGRCFCGLLKMMPSDQEDFERFLREANPLTTQGRPERLGLKVIEL